MCIISWAGQEGGQRGAFQKQVLGWWTVPGPVAGCSESWGTSLRDMDVKLAENRAALGGLCIQAHGGRGLPDTGEKDPSRGLGQDRHPTEDGTCGRESRVRRCQPLDRTGCVCVLGQGGDEAQAVAGVSGTAALGGSEGAVSIYL